MLNSVIWVVIVLLIATLTSDCVSQNDNLTTLDMIKREGYQAEMHTVITDDGFVLTLHRIPKPRGASTVFLQHGISSNSFDFVLTGKNNALAFILADCGYDVWMGNARGNQYSKRHLRYSPSESQFWNFSWHEMGIYDLPAEITYITNLRNDNIIYIGHSMGTTMFYVMAIERPDIAEKVKLMISLAPVAFIYQSRSPIFRFSPIVHRLERLAKRYDIFQLNIESRIRKVIARSCQLVMPFNNICLQSMRYFIGELEPHLNHTYLPIIWTHTTGGTSTKTVFHYFQLKNSGKFRQYDYGERGNLMMYNSTVPPDYDLSKIQVPIAIFWSGNDYFSNSQDIEKLYNLLPKKLFMYKVPSTNFSHLDYLWGIDAPKLLYPQILHVMDKYR